MLIPIGLVLLLGQAPILPVTIESGSEVRLVSVDLLRVYATGRVVEGRLEMFGRLPPGQQLRLLIFSMEQDKQSGGETGVLGSALTGIVDADGRSILVIVKEGHGAVDFGAWLQKQFGISMTFSERESP